MTFYSISIKQLAAFTFFMSLFTICTSSAVIYYSVWRLLPEVYISTDDGKCVKVVNFDNGHAFTCNDVDVILRRYKKLEFK